MALEDIFRALEEEADARCAELQAASKERVAQIAEDSERRCRELIRDRLERGQDSLAARARRIVNEAKMEHRRAVAAARQAAIDSVFDDAREALGGLRKDPRYQEWFSQLLDEALAAASDPTAITVDERDAELARSELAKRGRALPVEVARTAGGVVVSSGDGRVRFDNTLESRLERLRDEARSAVGELLFG